MTINLLYNIFFENATQIKKKLEKKQQNLISLRFYKKKLKNYKIIEAGNADVLL